MTQKELSKLLHDIEVDHGKLYNYPGNYSEFVRLKAERQNMELATERKRKSLLRTELEWLHRGARARSTKQKAHIDRIHAMQEMKDIQEEKRVMLDSVASRMGNKTIELSGPTCIRSATSFCTITVILSSGTWLSNKPMMIGVVI